MEFRGNTMGYLMGYSMEYDCLINGILMIYEWEYNGIHHQSLTNYVSNMGMSANGNSNIAMKYNGNMMIKH